MTDELIARLAEDIGKASVGFGWTVRDCIYHALDTISKTQGIADAPTRISHTANELLTEGAKKIIELGYFRATTDEEKLISSLNQKPEETEKEPPRWKQDRGLR